MTERSIPALRQILTLSSPTGTVGGTTGLTMNPRSRKYFDKACGSDVINPKIGVGGFRSKWSMPSGKGS